MFKKILVTVLIFICFAPIALAFHNVDIDIPQKMIGGSQHLINISFQGEDIRIPYYINITIIPIDAPSIWMGDFKVGNCNETMNGTFICEMLSQEGYNSYSLNISSNPALYPGNYSIEVSLVGAMEVEEKERGHHTTGTVNICGDGECGTLEDCESCPEDCGVCEANETTTTIEPITIGTTTTIETTTTVLENEDIGMKDYTTTLLFVDIFLLICNGLLLFKILKLQKEVKQSKEVIE